MANDRSPWDFSYKHGHARHGKHKRSGTYMSWCSMKQRVLNSKNSNYARYGGRGIKIAEAWLDFSCFYTDMGERPRGLSLERRDNDGGYTPENCYWATREQQHANTSRTKRLTKDSVTLTATQWAERLGVNAHSLLERIREGWSDEDVLNCPFDGTLRHYTRPVPCDHIPRCDNPQRCGKCGQLVPTTAPITIDGVTQHARQWAKVAKVKRRTVERRLKSGWNPKDAVFTPANQQPAGSISLTLKDVRLAWELLR